MGFSYEVDTQKKTYKFFVLTVVVHANIWFASPVDDLEREMLDIRLNLSIQVVTFTTN